MIFLKRTLPIAIAFAVGLWFALQYFVPVAWSDKTLDYVSNWVKIISGVALALGLYSLCHLHWRRIRRRQPGYGYSILVYVGLLTTFYFGFVGEVRHFFEIALRRPIGHHVYLVQGAGALPDGAATRSVALAPEERRALGIEAEAPVVTELLVEGKTIGYSFDPHVFHADPATGRVPAAERWLESRGIRLARAAGEAAPPPPGAVVVHPVRGAAWYAFASYQGYGRNWGDWFTWQFDHVYSTAQQTMFSMLGFFIASAAYRTFRARTLEAGVLLVAALIVIFGRTTLAGYASAWFPDAAEWIMQVPNLAAQRGILLGVALGSIATALRIIFGVERAYLGGD